jgi:hypothetical protein
MDRDAVLRRFEQWLDETLSSEDPPGGIDSELLRLVAGSDPDSSPAADPPGDAYTLSAALTALTHEIKLQGRAFKELHNALGLHVRAAADEIRAAYRERERDVQREAERRSRREMLSALIDLRDRLGRGLDPSVPSNPRAPDAAGWRVSPGSGDRIKMRRSSPR